MKHALRLVAVSVVAALGSAGAQDVHLSFNGTWPLFAMPSAEEQAKDAAKRAYAVALQAWLDENPGVQLETRSFNIWSQQALLTGIAGGTTPTFFNGNVLGNWNTSNIRNALKQGLAANTTAAVKKYGIESKLPKYVLDAFKLYAVDGQYYGLPESYVPGFMVYYRKDLVRQLGLKEPAAGWTWDDFFALARGLTTATRRGAAIQSHIPQQELDANGFRFLTRTPAPGTAWNWRWDYSSLAPVWAGIMNRWRQAIFEEKSVLVGEKPLTDREVAEAFLRGDAAMFINNPTWFTRPPSDSQSMAGFAERLGRKLDDVVGVVPMPRGRLDTLPSSQPSVSFIAFPPDISAAELEKAVSLYEYFYFGEGFNRRAVAAYQATRDARYAYGSPLLLNGKGGVPGIPRSIRQTWGNAFVDNVLKAARVPLVPEEGLFIPAEANPGPAATAYEDAYNRAVFAPGRVDFAADLARAEATVNQQAASFKSSVPDAAFRAGATAYYAALGDFWKRHSPKFYAQVVRPWLDATIASALR